MSRQLRIAYVNVQPVVFWDDGETLEPGPELGVVQLPLVRLNSISGSLQAEVEALAAKLADSEML